MSKSDSNIQVYNVRKPRDSKMKYLHISAVEYVKKFQVRENIDSVWSRIHLTPSPKKVLEAVGRGMELRIRFSVQ